MDNALSGRCTTCPYEIAIRRSDPDSLMCSYNQINGVWACENEILHDETCAK